jgi:DNA-directed RNA polymerase subunit RPC12/RpoP
MNILDDITNKTEFYYKCTKCNKTFEPTDEDTLRFRQTFNNAETTIRNNSMLLNAAFDTTNPATYKDCPKCSKKIVRYVVIGDTMKYIYTCECGAIF